MFVDVIARLRGDAVWSDMIPAPPFVAEVVSINQTGFVLIGGTALAQGQVIEVDFGDTPKRASIAWTRAEISSCEFVERLSRHDAEALHSGIKQARMVT